MKIGDVFLEYQLCSFLGGFQCRGFSKHHFIRTATIFMVDPSLKDYKHIGKILETFGEIVCAIFSNCLD